MIPVADGGGGGGVRSFDVDVAAATEINGKVSGAANALDDHAGSTPGAPDAGEATALLNDVIASFAHVAGALSQEAGMLGDIGTAMLGNYGDMDDAVDVVMRDISNRMAP